MKTKESAIELNLHDYPFIIWTNNCNLLIDESEIPLLRGALSSRTDIACIVQQPLPRRSLKD